MGKIVRTEAERLNLTREKVYDEARADPPPLTARQIFAEIEALTRTQTAIIQSLSALETKLAEVQKERRRY